MKYFSLFQGNTARTLSRQSAPPFLFARGDAGDGCQQPLTWMPIPPNVFNALLSANFPLPITQSAFKESTTSSRCLSHLCSSFLAVLPEILSGVTFTPLSPLSNMSGQWLSKNTFSKILSELPYVSARRPQILVPETSSWVFKADYWPFGVGC